MAILAGDWRRLKAVRSLTIAGLAFSLATGVAYSAERTNSAPVKRWGLSLRMPDGGLVRFDGAEAKPLSPALWEVSDFRLESFKANGPKEILVESPRCTVDVTKKIASSAGTFAVSQEQNGLKMTGLGFHYDDIEKRLIVSNNVVVVIRAKLVK
ncbi:MAG TPA: hypothetical protein VMF06_23165 [Candidatus Limnocylindria bacterium]|nr:hypothetical protein [Candidatus Limnocylindria bacterium]